MNPVREPNGFVLVEGPSESTPISGPNWTSSFCKFGDKYCPVWERSSDYGCLRRDRDVYLLFDWFDRRRYPVTPEAKVHRFLPDRLRLFIKALDT